MQKKQQTNASSAIEKIEEFQRFGSILGLERMNALLELLGNPQDELKIIHVAGTNGKGSICRYIYSVLQAAGYKTGLFTSPFLEVFNERIELDGKYISDEELAEYTERVLTCVETLTTRGEQSPTEFEVITAIAFLYFKEKGCDYAVMEVGLGGRGDSTNVCKSPLISVIASISYDHTDRLGNTIAEIAAEKAGIIKEGCPVVTSAEAEDALKVIEDRASERWCQASAIRAPDLILIAALMVYQYINSFTTIETIAAPRASIPGTSSVLVSPLVIFSIPEIPIPTPVRNSSTARIIAASHSSLS